MVCGFRKYLLNGFGSTGDFEIEKGWEMFRNVKRLEKRKSGDDTSWKFHLKKVKEISSAWSGDHFPLPGTSGGSDSFELIPESDEDDERMSR